MCDTSFHDSSSQVSFQHESAPPLSKRALKQLKISYKSQFCHAQDIGDEENFQDYKSKGYHPAYIGELYRNGKYQIVQKLGWGTFSTVWLIKNLADSRYYALKIQKSHATVLESAIDELSILKQLTCKASQHTIQLLDFFPHFGTFGNHFCSVFEILGPTLLQLIDYHERDDRLIPTRVVKAIAKQVLRALAYIHDQGIIHTDIKPENVMLALDANQKVAPPSLIP